MGIIINIQGKGIYVEEFGTPENEAILYLHGGPGASCIDFCYYQAKILSQYYYVITLDQRGVLRSDPIMNEEDFSINDLLNDFEFIRTYFSIERWNLIGHSFGGYVALKYAITYDNSIKSVVYECPSFDIEDSVKSLFRTALKYIDKEDTSLIDEVNNYINGKLTASELLRTWGNVSNTFNFSKDLIYYHSITSKEYTSIFDEHTDVNQFWDRTGTHSEKLFSEGELNKNLISYLSKVNQPSLLIYGKYDPVVTQKQVLAFQTNANKGKVLMFEKSGHLPRIEEPEKYTQEIIAFLSSASNVQA